MGFPDFNNDGRASVAERAEAYQIIGMIEDADQGGCDPDEDPAPSSNASDLSCGGCLIAFFVILFVIVVVPSIVSCAQTAIRLM